MQAKRVDKLHKIRSFITEVLSNIEAGWACYQELTVDEAMIRVKSKRCTFIQHMPVSAQITTYFFRARLGARASNMLQYAGAAAYCCNAAKCCRMARAPSLAHMKPTLRELMLIT